MYERDILIFTLTDGRQIRVGFIDDLHTIDLSILDIPDDLEIPLTEICDEDDFK